MSIEQTATRSRRALLAGAFGGIAALVANAVGRPGAVLGADVVLGGTNNTTATTTIQNSSNTATVLKLVSAQSVPLAAHGDAGVLFVSRRTAGVTAVQSSNPQLIRVSGVHAGVVGRGEDAGVRGSSAARVGVLGVAGGDGPSSMPPNAGVYGWSTAESFGVSYGVLGRSTAPTGYGVFGTSSKGSGVQGFTKDGSAVSAQVAAGGTGRALSVTGRVRFSSSGLATVASGNNQKVVDPGVPLTANSKVLTTLMGNAGATVTVKRVEVDAAADKFTIFLTGAAVNAASVAWFVLD